MNAKETAIEHLHSLQQNLADWQRYRKSYKLKDLKRDRDIQNMVFHALLVTIQSCIDIAHYIIAHLGLPKPNSYRESFEILSSHGYLNEEVARELQDLAGFRNVLVHIYWRLDIDRVNEILQTKYEFIQNFVDQIRELLK
ncbi:MAG: DUF86 domain-containing protein [bacterium]